MTKNTKHPKKIDKGLIFLKSTVLGLFIVLVTLMAAFVMTKNKKDQEKNQKTVQCNGSGVVGIAGEIDEVEEQGNILNVITKVNKKTNSQEIIRIHSGCINEINRIEFKIKD